VRVSSYLFSYRALRKLSCLIINLQFLMLYTYIDEAFNWKLASEWGGGIFWPNKEKVRGNWWQLRVVVLHSLYSSRGVVRVSKATRMRWAGHVGCPCMMGNTLWAESLQNLGRDVWVILKWN
jgi:hypothetical protein